MARIKRKLFDQFSGEPWFETLPKGEWHICDSCGRTVEGYVRMRVVVLGRQRCADGVVRPAGVLRIEHADCPPCVEKDREYVRHQGARDDYERSRKADVP